MVEMDLLNVQTVRDQCIGHIEVLERVKEILLLPRIDCFTTRQVAEWYEVDYNAIYKLWQRNQNELESDGARRVSLADFTAEFGLDKMSNPKQGSRVFQLSDDVTITMRSFPMISETLSSGFERIKPGTIPQTP